MNIINLYDCSIKSKQQHMFDRFSFFIAKFKSANQTAYEFYKNNEDSIFNFISFKKQNYTEKEHRWIYDNFIILCLMNYFEENTHLHKCSVNLFCNDKKLTLQLSCRFDDKFNFKNHLRVNFNISSKNFLKITDNSIGDDNIITSRYTIDNMMTHDFWNFLEDKKNVLINIPKNRKTLINLLETYPEKICKELKEYEDVKKLNCSVFYKESTEPLVFKKIEKGIYPFIVVVDDEYSEKLDTSCFLYGNRSMVTKSLQAYLDKKKLECLLPVQEDKQVNTSVARI